MSKPSADAFQESCGKLFVLSRVHTSMAPEVSFAKVQEITDALSRACSMANNTGAPLVDGLKRFVEQRILPNGALDLITEQGFRLPADEAQEQENVHRLQSRSWPSFDSRVQTLFADAEAREKSAVKAEAKAKVKVAEEVAMATAAAAAAAAAATAKEAAKEEAEEAKRKRCKA
ncbi:hypothetical protein Ctob_001511 [Chrysochromulina tobinii]|uniref:Uncharacterized protein n=1 Tax=Chrysochromulina tobinii TaxID=1460289 RepID=A0A0M0JD55_9EUKA|nr:hypothetical protein Ctob_001511 [Chrysochromulina tobinii]|eukprot:KOO24302.1 hypothetical protein Ctob_001511 [Chrysochromulina sp. CCMP291]